MRPANLIGALLLPNAHRVHHRLVRSHRSATTFRHDRSASLEQLAEGSQRPPDAYRGSRQFGSAYQKSLEQLAEGCPEPGRILLQLAEGCPEPGRILLQLAEGSAESAQKLPSARRRIVQIFFELTGAGRGF